MKSKHWELKSRLENFGNIGRLNNENRRNTGIIENSRQELDFGKDFFKDKSSREFVIKRMWQLLDVQLDELECIMFEISEVEFGFDEESVNLYKEGHDEAGFYERIGEIDKPLNAVRKLAEIKRYLEARNVSLIEKAETD